MTTGPRLQNVDLLRAVAIVAVLLFHFTFHFTKALPGIDRPAVNFPLGYLGVDLFFVVSGYCIFMTMERVKRVRAFWIKRFARLQPVYMAGVFLTFTTVAIFGLTGREVSVAEAAGNLVWLTLYPRWPMVDGAYWSLLVELKFYFWVGVVYHLTGGRHVSLAWAGFCIAGIIALQLPGAERARTILIPDYAPSFLIGMIAYEADKLGRRNVAALLACAFILEAFTISFRNAGLWLIVTVAAGYAVLRMPNLRVWRPITFVGLISYPLYIIHDNIGYIVIREIPGPIELRIALAMFVAGLLGTLLWWALDKRFEKPIAAAIYRATTIKWPPPALAR